MKKDYRNYIGPVAKQINSKLSTKSRISEKEVKQVLQYYIKNMIQVIMCSETAISGKRIKLEPLHRQLYHHVKKKSVT